jgi:hypothetical protein
MTRGNTLDPSKSIFRGYTTGGITDTESACLPVGRDTDTQLKLLQFRLWTSDFRPQTFLYKTLTLPLSLCNLLGFPAFSLLSEVFGLLSE